MTRLYRSLWVAVAVLSVSASAAAGPLNFFRNVIDSDFPSTAFPNVRYPVDVQAADMDGDTDLDLVVTVHHRAGTGEGIYWYENDGAFAFAKTYIDTMLVDTDIDPVRIDVRDVDDDADNDVVLVGANRLYLYTNDGGGTFSRTTVDDITGALRLARIADVDGDADEDIVLLANGGLYYWQNDGSENFTRVPVHVIPTVDVALAVVDLDLDADVDIVASMLQPSGDRHLTWYKNNGSGSFGVNVLDVLQGTEDLGDAFVADVDRDGRLDITVAKTTDNTILWYRDLGGQVYTTHVVTTAFNQAPQRVWVSDLDNDVDEEIMAVGGNGAVGEVVYWENDGAEAFTTRSVEATAGNRQGLFVVDLDGDLLDDLLVTNAFPAELVWFDNLGTGTGVSDAPRAARVRVHPSVPNPFNPSTTIGFELSPAGAVEVDVFAVDGAKVRTLLRGTVGAGDHEVRWDGRDDHGRRVASGVYIARVRAHGLSRTTKLVLVM